MPLKNSISLLLFFTSWIGLSYFVKFMQTKEPFVDTCQTRKPHPFLCGEKMALHQARPFELALIDGVSVSLARHIHQFLRQNPEAGFEGVDGIKGVGAKTFAKITLNFFEGDRPKAQ